MAYRANIIQYVKIQPTLKGLMLLAKHHNEYWKKDNSIGNLAVVDECVTLRLGDLIRFFGEFEKSKMEEFFINGEIIFLDGELVREENPDYKVGERVLTEAVIVEVDEGIGDVKIKVGLTEMWLRESQVVRK
ncbi:MULTISPECIES: hypothetical protein [Paenibacillus]|uniref:Uncharacterized protein n=1 Tax=Paenibacillus odorifer TaxID=189426 RepID=A0ABX3GLW7_9BACL|nr:hypothetical protein [Paenibacillus odorifer]OMD32638.1 hypothetical protein BSO21_16260 [Paenibacillus odorifer]